jgi:hypothetical protein
VQGCLMLTRVACLGIQPQLILGLLAAVPNCAYAPRPAQLPSSPARSLLCPSPPSRQKGAPWPFHAAAAMIWGWGAQFLPHATMPGTTGRVRSQR